MSDYWINIEVDEDTSGKMNKTIEHCNAIDQWAIEAFKKFWLLEKRVPYANTLSKNISEYISRNKVYSTQRFTLNKAVEDALRDFRGYLVEKNGQVELQIPSIPAISEFKIAPRKVWIKYIEDMGYISTYYGPLQFTGQWLGIIGNQLSEAHITYGMLPYLWHSLSIKRELEGEQEMWAVKINFHNPASYQGKRGKKEYRIEQVSKKEKEKKAR